VYQYVQSDFSRKHLSLFRHFLCKYLNHRRFFIKLLLNEQRPDLEFDFYIAEKYSTVKFETKINKNT